MTKDCKHDFAFSHFRDVRVIGGYTDFYEEAICVCRLCGWVRITQPGVENKVTAGFPKSE